MSAKARIAVLGAGSVGCFIGGAWQAAGLPITFIGRPNIAQAIDRHGLTLSDYAGWRAHLKPGEVDYRCGSEALGDAQVILVTVKSGATAEAAAQIAAHARDGATVISFQNGISNIETLERALGGRFEIARGMVGFNIAYLGDGQFHKGVAGHLWADRCEATIMLADSLREGPAALTLSSDMLGLAWGKLLINMNNAVNALSGRSLWDELHNRNYRRLFSASILEGLRILRRAEIAPAKVGPLPPLLLARVLASPDWLFNTLFFRTWKIDRKARSSMADDIAEGRRTEVDYINGELIRLAERVGMHAPVNRAIVELIRKAESGARPLEPVALRKAVLGR